MKEVIRKKYIEKRKDISISKKQKADKEIFLKLKEHAGIRKSKHIMVYVSLENEVDTGEFIEYLLSEKKNVYIPVVEDDNIKAVQLFDLNDLNTVNLGIREPDMDKRVYADLDIIEVIVVPGVCFTKTGIRLGRGQGYYDRFLAGVSVKTSVIGICYSTQIENQIPYDEKDVQMGEVITEVS